MTDKYEAIVIGAGIGGLTCACYLANAGLKTLIIEQHYKAGGYCTSFERKGYKFDVAVHYFGGIKKGILNIILTELKLRNQIKFNQFDPTDKIITPNVITYIRTNPIATVRGFIENFPKEKENIRLFFNFITKGNLIDIYKKTNKITFKSLLDNYFKDTALKTTFNTLIRNIGSCANETSSLAAVVLLREYIMDPGYYPEGGTQKLADVLLNKFIKLGGEVKFSTKVDKIITENKKVKGVVVKNNNKITAEYIVSGVDASQTFKKLINSDTPEVRLINKLQISPTVFAVYLGLKLEYKNIIKTSCSIWPFLTYNLAKSPVLTKNEIINGENIISLITFPSFHNKIKTVNDRPTMQLLALVPYETKEFWKKKRKFFSNRLINEAEKIFPLLKKSIVVKETATPMTFEHYTLNTQGSGFGWASTVPQISATAFPTKTSIKGLFVTGHWCTMGTGQGGIPKVAFAGRRTANLIIKELGRKSIVKDYIL